MLSHQQSHPLKEEEAEERQKTDIRTKGKHASSTENRRMVWENVVWPLVLELNRSYFTLKEYHAKRDSFCTKTGTSPSRVAGGFVSLLVKGILVRSKNMYSIH
ncbi:MAG: hypothetical protein M3093_04865, partial [Thermoproteota archaeon]|nr:hypothetical protein [Thermoproteota archaeon]